MPNLLAMSFEGPLAPSFDLKCLRAGQAGETKLPDGWGIGYYPGGEPCAPVLKESAPPRDSIRSELARAWEHLESSLFVVHVRRATWGPQSDANTQPFSRAHGGRDWLFAHAGSLERRLDVAPDTCFVPVGSTDSERVFCHLLERISKAGYSRLVEVPLEVLHGWLLELNAQGSLTLTISDGRDLIAYSDAHQVGQLWLAELKPPYGSAVFSDDDLRIDLTSRRNRSWKGVLLCSEALVCEGDVFPYFRLLAPGTLVVVRQGAVERELTAPGFPPPVAPSRGRTRPHETEPRRFDVLHRTVYRYARPVERSSHKLRLFPVHDRLQSVVASEVTVSVDGTAVEYEDVFNNRVRAIELDAPYTELVIEARSTVDVLDTNPLRSLPLHARSTIPLVWMPWQRQVLEPFLLPPELPETQLRELVDYAMSFVTRNDFDLLDTLLDINATIFEEYAYRQGTTTLATTAFDVFVQRQGVCQDFANLFICLARLLGVPARYVCGYVYVGPTKTNTVQAEESHAWVQVYLPEVGWRGFDPTNGILTQTDHVRVAVGRNYVDATPTSGTIYTGGGGETLEVLVRAVPIER